ncbi:transcriptional regulator, TetR family [Xylanimonas cellulosilytica DSM 15894]|uniref:Transcriptional regulator, TetR family n=1 Tax=Xylanimonas cellulosilytica (strain DSM 15894 / JCM 12276 / CECT 5975 / KCTC 9989 / LMG 20990 / NBRC 107835 / XIL07) TaxID=446471 RepID=D1BVR8_XYLCX|nr:TetR/AcrR family transcriptional regulator [Xylanimonas cellulosilytica]ACZ31387.1 transcriptional regulator, TetR family [Xylanimonas cellulosilytica DSM 15894]
MGRPSIAAERTTQILDAVGRCVARYGLEGVTLDHVASESGLSRSHVRHYVGNKAELLSRFRDHLLRRYQAPDLARAAELGMRPTEYVLHMLFEHEPDLDWDASHDAVVAAARSDDALRAELHAVYTGLEAFVAQALAADQPDWSDERVAATAAQVVALEYGHATMTALGLASARTTAAHRLARSLLGLPPTADVPTTETEDQ